MTRTQAALLCLTMCAFAAPAEAQMKWTDRGFVNVNFGANAGSVDLAGDTTFDLYDEAGTMTYDASIEPRALFDVSGGIKVWRNLAVGLGYSRVSKTDSVPVTVAVPDPLFFDAPRTVTTDLSGLEHSQNAVHVMAVWMVPVTDKIDVALSGGPTFFSVSQSLPTSVTATEPGPAVTIATQSFDESAVGVNVGVDVTYLFTKTLGAGLLLRYSGASVEFEGLRDKVDVGGFQFGVGVRVRF